MKEEFDISAFVELGYTGDVLHPDLFLAAEALGERSARRPEVENRCAAIRNDLAATYSVGCGRAVMGTCWWSGLACRI